MQRKLIFLVCFHFIFSQGYSQRFPFFYYTPKDGLVNSRVKIIKQDSRGFIYFITRSGLSVYDGARFVNYSQENGLANELVNDVVEMAPDSLLVATNVSMMNTLVHGKVGVFKTIDNFYPVVNRFFKSKNGLWYVAADEGLFVLSENRFIKIPIYDKEENEIGKNLDRISEWKNLLFLTTWDHEIKEKLIVYDRTDEKVLATVKNRIVYSIDVNGKGQFLATTDGGISGIDTTSLLKNGKMVFLPVPVAFRKVAGLKHAIVYFDQQGNTWFAGKEGFYKITTSGEFSSYTAAQGLKITNLTSLFIDKEGNAWIATDGSGVAKLSNSGIELRDKLDGVAASVLAIVSKGDSLWAYNHFDNAFYRITKNDITKFPAMGLHKVVVNLYTRNDKLYIVTQNQILCANDMNNPASYLHPEKIIEDRNVQFGNGVIDHSGNFIIEMTSDGRSFYTAVIRNDQFLFRYHNAAIADQMALDSKGRLWLITRNNQLLLFSLHPDDPEHYMQLQKDYSHLIPGLGPRSITVDKNDQVWIGTRYNGIYSVQFRDSRLDTILHFTTKDGLTDNFVYTLACDTSGNVWVGTQTGLDKIMLKNGRYIFGNISRSIELYQSIRAIVATKDNTVWALPNEESLIKISSGSPILISTPPKFTFTEMKVNDSIFSLGVSRFRYTQNNFSFSVAAPSFINEKSIRYSYLLLGSGNEKWSVPSNQSTFNFINLSPAVYSLKVKCEFPEERYASQVISYSFVIDPPWWQAWWFRIVAIVFMLGFVFVTLRFYFKRKLEKAKAALEKQQAVEKERTRIATDMHDDLGAGLSRIKFLSETIGIKKQKDEPIEEDISKIRDYSHEMIGKMGEIVWALNEKNDSLSDLLSFTRSYAVEYLSQNGIDCTVDAPDNLPADFVSGEFRRNIYLVVKEALHNIVKHAQANHVTLKIIPGHQLQICIEDDGIGFDRSTIRPFSNGLSNMEKRITEIGGKFVISGEKGTTIRITAPMKT